MYTIYCSHVDYDNVCDAMARIDTPEIVTILAQDWALSGTVYVKIGKESSQAWSIQDAQQSSIS